MGIFPTFKDIPLYQYIYPHNEVLDKVGSKPFNSFRWILPVVTLSITFPYL